MDLGSGTVASTTIPYEVSAKWIFPIFREDLLFGSFEMDLSTVERILRATRQYYVYIAGRYLLYESTEQ